MSRVWHGNLKPHYLYSIIVPFILFELWVHGAISRHMRQGRDLPVIRRYIGALIETSMPTVALALHIDSMGSVAALGFVGADDLFHLHHPLDAAAGFLALHLHRLRRRQRSCSAWRCFYHPDGRPGAQRSSITPRAARSS